MNTHYIKALWRWLLLTSVFWVSGAAASTDADLHIENLAHYSPSISLEAVDCCQQFVDLEEKPLKNGDSTWLKMELGKTVFDNPRSPYLIIPRYVIHGTLDLYVPIESGGYHQISMGGESVIVGNHSGDTVPINLGNYSLRKDKPLYLHIQSPYDYSAHSLVTPLLPEVNFDYFEERTVMAYIYIAYSAAILVLAVYYLLFFYSTKNVSYFFYSLSALAVLLVSARGIFFYFVNYSQALFLTYVFQSCASLGLYIFFYHFLQIKKLSHRTQFVTKGIIGLSAVAQFFVVISTIWIPAIYTAAMLGIISMISIGFFFFTMLAWKVWRSGSRDGLYVFSSCLVFYLGVCFWRLADHFFQIEADELFTFSIMFGAHFLESFVIALGLADNIHRIRIERDSQSAEFLNLMKNQNVMLEQQVKERTTALEEKNKNQSLFLANLSHEIRTPLTLIMGPLEQIVNSSNQGIDSRDKHLLNMSLRNTRSILRMVDDVLDIKKMESPFFNLNLSKNDIAQHLVNVCEKFELAADTQKMSITPPASNSLYLLVYDTQRMEKVFDNLINNAIKYAGIGSKLKISIQEEGDKVHILFDDDGKGISAPDKQKIFEYYYQTADSQSLQKPGTGVGLAYARQIAQEHHGSLALVEKKSEGACFCLSLIKGRQHFGELAVQSESFTAGEEHYSFSEVNSSCSEFDPCLLIVDDNDELLEFLEHRLGSNYRIVTAKNGIEAIEKTQKYMPDVVVTDVMMPEMDGFELTNVLKSTPETAAIPVIILTTKNTHKDRMEGLSFGTDDYLEKPFDAAELSLKINNAIHTQKQLREQLIAQFKQASENSPEAVNKSPYSTDIEQAIYNHVREGVYSSEQLAQSLNMSRSTLYRKCKAELKKSPSDLLKDIKLDYAMELLRSKQGNVSQISYAIGFDSLSHFSKSFKEKFGESPSFYIDS